MRKWIVLALCLLCGCSSTTEESGDVTSNVKTTAQRVYTASPKTTAQPIINIVTTPLRETTVTEQTEAAPLQTVIVSTYATTTVTTATLTTAAITTTPYPVSDEMIAEGPQEITTSQEEKQESEVAVSTTTATTVTTSTAMTTEVATVPTSTAALTYPPMYDKVTNVGLEAIAEINKQRQKTNLAEYVADEYLCIAANLRAREIAEYFSHRRVNRTNFSTVLTEYGFSYDSAAEAIGVGYADAASMVYAWTRSAEDNKTIFDTKYGFTHVGVGYYYLEGKSYWVMLVMEPANT